MDFRDHVGTEDCAHWNSQALRHGVGCVRGQLRAPQTA